MDSQNLVLSVGLELSCDCIKSTGYTIYYTTDSTRDGDWIAEGVMGDKMTTTIKGLTPSTTYFFKIQARNSKGFGPFSPVVSLTTSSSEYLI